MLEDVNKLLVLRDDKVKLMYTRDENLNKRKTLSKDIGKFMREGKEAEAADLKAQVEDANKLSSEAEEKLAVIDEQINYMLSRLPNLLDDQVPDGEDEESNVEVRSWGAEKRLIGDDYLWHDDVAAKVGGIDTEAATRISGARFCVLKGPIARLERAIGQYFLDFHVSRGYEEVSVPYIVSRSTLEGTGQLPKFEDDLFKVSHSVSGEDAFMIPTAEVPVTNLYKQQLLDEAVLPIKHTCLTPSFRAEAGSYGRDTRGLMRQHQFHKVEMVKICTPDTSAQEHADMTRDAEQLLENLNLPYRTVMLCSGDIGFSARICYDIEVWMPAQQTYREISSCSNCYDFQARRMSLRYRGQKKEGEKKAKTVYPHTLNGSGVAVGRALVAVLENYQQPDGSVIIPEVLRPYMGNMEKIDPIA
jgi:seryl-tRNA synthetase